MREGHKVVPDILFLLLAKNYRCLQRFQTSVTLFTGQNSESVSVEVVVLEEGRPLGVYAHHPGQCVHGLQRLHDGLVDINMVLHQLHGLGNLLTLADFWINLLLRKNKDWPPGLKVRFFKKLSLALFIVLERKIGLLIVKLLHELDFLQPLESFHDCIFLVNLGPDDDEEHPRRHGDEAEHGPEVLVQVDQ